MRQNFGYSNTGGMGGGFLDEFKNAFSKPDNGLIQIILINISVFAAVMILRVILTLSGGQELYQSFMHWLMIPASVPTFLTRPWTIVSYFFLHEGVFHILFNMLFLYWFGRIIKDFIGGGKLISLYVLGGLAGGIFYLLIYNLLPYFAERVDGSVMLGASGAVFAVVVGAATLAPNYTMFLLFLGPVRIKYIALFYVVLSFAQSTGSNAGGELAHLGGALIGFFYIKLLQSGKDLGSWVHSIITFFKSFFVKQPNVKVSYRRSQKKTTTKTKTSTAAKSSSNTSQDEIDAILDKISQSGYESLTTDEKQKLFNASKK